MNKPPHTFFNTATSSGGAAIPFTGTTGKWGARLKASASGGNLSALVGNLSVYDIRDFGAVDDDSTDCGPAYQAAVDAAIAAAGTAPVIIYTPASTSYWRIKTGIVKDNGTHTQFASVRQIYFVGEGDAGPVRVDCAAGAYVFDLDFGEGQIAFRDMRAGFVNMTFVTSNDTGYVKGADCAALFGIKAADAAQIRFQNINLVGMWSGSNHFLLFDGCYKFDNLLVNAGYCGFVAPAPSTPKSIASLTGWAFLQAEDFYHTDAAHFRGTTWASSSYASFWECAEPEDDDSIVTLRRFYADGSCQRIFWCTQVTAHRLRALHAEDFVTTIGAQPTFDMKKTNATLIERGEFELGTGTVFINGTSCDNTTLRNIRATFGGTNMHGVFDSTCTSVVVDECELGTDSPFPAGVTSDAPITRVIKNGRWFKLHLIGGVYVATDGIESTWLQASALAASAPGSVTSAAVSQTNGTDVIATKSGVSIAGVRFYWDGSSNKTIKCRLWNPNGTGATSVNVAVTTAGIYEGYFTSPITLTPYGQYKISTWETTGAVNLYMSGAQVLTATNSAVPVASFYGKAIGNAVYRSSGFYAAGDACPVNADAADLILVDPILF